MQKLTCYALALVVITLFVIPQSSQGTGLGLYLPSWGSGSATITFDEGFESERDVSHLGIGFVLDSKVAQKGVFNYRLHLGFESSDYDLENNFSRFAIDNTFGFGIVQSRVVRLWLGPQIRLAYQTYSDENVDYNIEINSFGIGLAPVLGMNLNLGSVVSICPEIGFRATFFGGTENYEDYYYGGYEETFTTTETHFFINLAILFRIGDVYDDFF